MRAIIIAVILSLIIVVTCFAFGDKWGGKNFGVDNFGIGQWGAVNGSIKYYVSNDGLDANDGLTEETPFETIAHINTEITLEPGESVLLKRGDVWREQLIPQGGEQGNRTTYGAYGTGDRPLLIGSIEANETGDWSDQTGNVWMSVVGTYDIGNIIFNSEAIVGVKVWNAIDLDTQGEYWYDEINDQVNLYSVGNPATFYTDIELAEARIMVFVDDLVGLNIESLELKYGGAPGIYNDDVSYVTISDCYVSYVGGGEQPGTTEVRYGNGIIFWSDAQNVIVEYCNVGQTYDAGVSAQSTAICDQRNIFFRYNTIWNNEYSFEYWNRPAESSTSNIRFENNTCTNAGGGWSHDQRPDPTGRHVYLGNTPATTTNGINLNNNTYDTSTATCLFLNDPALFPIAQLFMDNNEYSNGTGTLVEWGVTDYTCATFDDYQTDTGKDLNSTCTGATYWNTTYTTTGDWDTAYGADWNETYNTEIP